MLPSSRRTITGLPFVCLALAGAAGCAATFQDARLVGPGRVEITPSVGGVGVSNEGESEYVATTFGAAARVGVADRFDLAFAYARFEIRALEEEAGLHAVAFGPKVGLVKDRVAVALPLSFAFGDDLEVSDTWELHPMALFTVPLSDRVDFNPSARLVVPLCSECDLSSTLVGASAGFGILASPRVRLRPEFGILVKPGESGVVWMFGLGVSIVPGR